MEAPSVRFSNPDINFAPDLDGTIGSFDCVSNACQRRIARVTDRTKRTGTCRSVGGIQRVRRSVRNSIKASLATHDRLYWKDAPRKSQEFRCEYRNRASISLERGQGERNARGPSRTTELRHPSWNRVKKAKHAQPCLMFTDISNQRIRQIAEVMAA